MRGVFGFSRARTDCRRRRIINQGSCDERNRLIAFSNDAADFLGVPIHLLTMRETEARIVAAMRERQPMQHVALNVAKFVNLRRDSELKGDVFGADLVSVDGMGILLGARLLGIGVPERVTGVDLMETMLARCAREGFRPYLLGARPEVLNRALKALARRHPSLQVAGSRHGYFSPAEEADVVEAICAAKPDCLFVGMPTPRKERFMAKHRATLEVPFVMGVGGGIDILAGHVRRAPSRLAAERHGVALSDPARAETHVAAIPSHKFRLCMHSCGSDVAESSGPLRFGMSAAIEHGRAPHTAPQRRCDRRRPTSPQVDDPMSGVSDHVVSPQAARGVSCRLIRSTNLEEIAELLHEGFPRRSTAGWMVALGRLDSHATPDGFPTYGYMLEAGRVAVGVLLLITTALEDKSGLVRCNVSSWYVRPAYRLYAPLLVSRAIKDRSVTYVNVSPASQTWPIIEAQGFRRFCNGAFAAMPILSLRSEPGRITRIDGAHSCDGRLPSRERRILKDHAKYGCISVCLETGDDVIPFVFRRRLFKRSPLPCAQLIYCRDQNDLARFARPLGRFLALRGMPWVLVGADAPIPNLAGRYFENKLPMYYMGTNRPRPGELAYTEAAVFGL